MLAVRFIGGREGGAARESKNEPEKKGRSVATELPEKTRRPASDRRERSARVG